MRTAPDDFIFMLIICHIISEFLAGWQYDINVRLSLTNWNAQARRIILKARSLDFRGCPVFTCGLDARLNMRLMSTLSAGKWTHSICGRRSCPRLGSCSLMVLLHLRFISSYQKHFSWICYRLLIFHYYHRYVSILVRIFFSLFSLVALLTLCYSKLPRSRSY